MKNEVIRKNDCTIYEVHFDDLFEVISFIEENDPFSQWGYSLSVASVSQGFDFTGTKSIEEAKKLCINGVQDDISNIFDMQNNLDKAFPILTQKRETSSSVYGFRPNIQKYLTNNPNSMYKLERKEQHKFLKIYFNASILSSIKKEQYINRGIIVMSLIKILEEYGYRVELNFFNLSKQRGEYIYIVTNIKKQSQILDKNICYFPMCHPSFPRRIMFAVRERCDVKESWSSGYGSTLNKEDTKKFLNLDSNDIIISSPDDFGIFGRNLYKEAESFLNIINFNKYFSLNENFTYDEEQGKFRLERKR